MTLTQTMVMTVVLTLNLVEDVMVMNYCHRCDVIRTSDDDAEYDGDYGRVRRCD